MNVLLENGLEVRVSQFSEMIFELSSTVKRNVVAGHLSAQMKKGCQTVVRSLTLASKAHSKFEFIHFLQMAIIGLKETMVCLEITKSFNLISNADKFKRAVKERCEISKMLNKVIEWAKEWSYRSLMQLAHLLKEKSQ